MHEVNFTTMTQGWLARYVPVVDPQFLRTPTCNRGTCTLNSSPSSPWEGARPSTWVKRLCLTRDAVVLLLRSQARFPIGDSTPI